MNHSPSAVASEDYPRDWRGGCTGFAELRKTARLLLAELSGTPQRWRRAGRVALLTAAGAGLTAACQIANPLGLTLLFNLGVPERALSFSAAARFLPGAAICQVLGLALAGAMADSAIPHLTIFAVLSLVSGYLIYADPRLGRIWVWVQVPVLTAFYLVIFDPMGFGWNDAEAFAGVALAVGLLYVSNTVLWPKSAAQVLSESLANTIDRSRRRLKLLLDIGAGVDGLTAEDDTPVASKLGYHLSLLGPAAGGRHDVEVVGALLAAAMMAERIHNDIDRIGELICEDADVLLDEGMQKRVLEMGAELDTLLAAYVGQLSGHAGAGDGDSRPPPLRGAQRGASEAAGSQGRAAGAPLTPCQSALAGRLENLKQLLRFHPAEMPRLSWPDAGRQASQPERPPQAAAAPAADAQEKGVGPRQRRNPFLLRYTVRHTIAMTLAFVSGLFTNNPAMHAALWLLMIGGPPSHGATVRKFTIRAIGSALALSLTAAGTILLAPNGTTVFSYMVVICAGTLVMAYIGEGGGLISYLSIGGTAFVIAFSGPGPRNDVFASIWTIWGITFGMLIRAVVALVWQERASRTLAEEFQAPIEALLDLVATARIRDCRAAQVHWAQMSLMGGLREMLEVASDAQLEGHGAGIDAANLVDALDSMRRVGFVLGSLALQGPDDTVIDERSAQASGQNDFEPLTIALQARFAGWLEYLREQEDEGVPSLAPLREMVLESGAPDLSPWSGLTGEQGRLIGLVAILEDQLKTISVH